MAVKYSNKDRINSKSKEDIDFIDFRSKKEFNPENNEHANPIDSKNQEIINLKDTEVIEDEEAIKIYLPSETRHKIGNTTFVVSHVYKEKGKILNDRIDEFLELKNKSLEEEKIIEFLNSREGEETVKLLSSQKTNEFLSSQEEANFSSPKESLKKANFSVSPKKDFKFNDDTI